MSNATTHGALLHNGARAHRSTEILLRLLGGLLVVSLVTCKYDFFTFLSNGCKLELDCVWIQAAYYAFVLNVFRQVHGLAIVTSRDGPGKGGTFTNFIEIAALLAVVLFPSYLIARVRHDVVLLAMVRPDAALPQLDVSLVLKAYLCSAAAYVVWDIADFYRDLKPNERGIKSWGKFTIVFAVCLLVIGIWIGRRPLIGLGLPWSWVVGLLIGATCGSVLGRVGMELSRQELSIDLKVVPSGFGECCILLVTLLKGLGRVIVRVIVRNRFCAVEPCDFALNFQAILLCTLLTGWYLFDGVKSIPVVLTIMCALYTGLDYCINRHFYFSS